MLKATLGNHIGTSCLTQPFNGPVYSFLTELTRISSHRDRVCSFQLNKPRNEVNRNLQPQLQRQPRIYYSKRPFHYSGPSYSPRHPAKSETQRFIDFQG